MKKVLLSLILVLSLVSVSVQKSEAYCKSYSWLNDFPSKWTLVRETKVKELTVREYRSATGFQAFHYLVEYPASAKEAVTLQIPAQPNPKNGTYGETHSAVRTIRPQTTLDSTCWVEVKNFTISVTGTASSQYSLIFMITEER